MENIKIVRDFIEKKYSPSDTSKSVQRLYSEKDIFKEFKLYIENGEKFPNDYNLINVNGYTVEKILKNTYLNILGAYNYLIYIRNNNRRKEKNGGEE